MLNHLSLQRKVKDTHQKTAICNNSRNIHIIDIHYFYMPIPDSASRPRTTQKIDLKDFMEKNFKSDMSMSEYAQASGRSLSTFKRDFKKFSALSPERWITARRLTAALDLLRRRRRVTDVCFDVGFKNVSHFSAAFKKKFGVTPGDIRKQKPLPGAQD